MKRSITRLLVCLIMVGPPASTVSTAIDYVDQLAANLEPTRTVVYKTVDDRELRLFIFDPPGFSASDKRPVFLTFHGGGWGGFEPRRQYPFATYFARLGLVGISVEYRLSRPDSGTTVFDCVRDARSAVRFLRKHANQLGVDPDRIVAQGNSAGAHLAVGTALFDGVDEPGEDLTISSRPDALVLFSPVLDTSPDGYGQAMIGERWRVLSPLHRVRSGLPPTVIFHGTEDTVTPLAGSTSFCEAMLRAENSCELIPLEGAAHGELMRTPLLFNEALREVGLFLLSAGFVVNQQSLKQ